ncbi:methyl-accepting chemotaxis protein [Oceanispirochaeta crateris]|uniref:Methyl-accepting chemotaxis protein n=1 Tax=Oceanispirochaeta crateris TaxID=2518645 RepID=A0A5C1QGS6_9SPIO|nr:methyl-accepting chemotaxis protein [Oceanispirochaeta crateris]QEN07313.1 methyl-accepting chemotaxis protein [Oceanispirochaeta crateris]
MGSKRKSIVKNNLFITISFGIIIGIVFPFYTMLFVTFKNQMCFYLFSIGAIIAGIIVGLISFLITKVTILRVLSVLSERLKDISEGEGDLTKSIELISLDEIGEMIKYFNSTIQNIRSLILTIRRKSDALTETGNNLFSTINQTVSAINQISANQTSIKNQIVNQSDSITETNATIRQISHNIENLNSQIDKQASNVVQSSSAIEEMMANISSVTNNLLSNADNMNELILASENGKSDLEVVSKSIQEVTIKSEELLNISSIIQAIASQTNLLSMNAAIEAAHAGDAGRGFAVVAEEIRKLSESSGAQAKTVTSAVKQINESMNKLTRATVIIQKQFTAIDNKIRLVSEIENQIQISMKKQDSDSNEILKAVRKLNVITTQVKSGSNEMLTGSQEIFQESNNLGLISDEVSTSMNEITSNVDQIKIAADKVNDLGKENNENIEAIMNVINIFKV